MSKTTMPEPVAWREWDGEYRVWEYHDADDLPVNFRSANGQFLIATKQAEAYAEAKVREPREWVDVNDRVPKSTDAVLAFWTTRDPDYEPGGIETSFYDGRNWQGANGNTNYHGSRRVTHWMPLPSPPTKGEEQ